MLVASALPPAQAGEASPSGWNGRDGIFCEVILVRGGIRIVCDWPTTGQSVALSESGRSKICTPTGGKECLRNLSVDWTKRYEGQRVVVGPFKCRVQSASVTCRVRATGDGVRISDQTIERVAG